MNGEFCQKRAENWPKLTPKTLENLPEMFPLIYCPMYFAKRRSAICFKKLPKQNIFGNFLPFGLLLRDIRALLFGLNWVNFESPSLYFWPNLGNLIKISHLPKESTHLATLGPKREKLGDISAQKNLVPLNLF